MKLEIIATPFELTLHGFFGDVSNDDYAAAGIPLLNALWDEIGAEKLVHKGTNYWAYPAPDRVFVGVVLDVENGTGKLEPFSLNFGRYAKFRHVGPYYKLGETHQEMHSELIERGLTPVRPSLEIYGHWQEDETKLETDVLMPVDG